MEIINLDSKLEGVEALIRKYELKYKIGIIGDIGCSSLLPIAHKPATPRIEPIFTEKELPNPNSTPTVLKYNAPPIYTYPISIYLSGQEDRRTRRKMERQRKKKHHF